MVTTADFVVFGALLVISVAFLPALRFVKFIRERQAEVKFRQNTLQYDENDKLYHWTTIDGVERSSAKHPAYPGGVWYDETPEQPS